jgi:hypothetical protein
MLITRRSRAGASVGAALIVMAAMVVSSAPSASATVSNCTISTDLSVNRVAFTCTENQALEWYLQLVCQRADKNLNYNGSPVYGPGTGTSIAQCPVNQEIVGTSVVEL